MRARLPAWNAFLARPRGMLITGLCLSLLLPVCFAVMLWFDLAHDNDLAAERATVAEQALQHQLDERLQRLGQQLQEIAVRAGTQDSGVPPEDIPEVVASATLTQVVLLPPGVGTQGVDRQGRPASASWLPPRFPDSQPPGLGIGPPIRVGTPQRWMVPVAWYGDPDRRVGALVDAGWFAEVLAGYSLGDDGVLDLSHVNGETLARAKGRQTTIGGVDHHTHAFAIDVQQAPSGRFEGLGPIDHVRRQYVYARMSHAPLVISAGVAEARIFSAWWPLALAGSVGALLFSGLWLWLNVIFARNHAAQGRLVDDLRLQTARAEEARRIAQLGDWSWNVESGDVIWSREVFTIWGLPFRDCPVNIDEITARVVPDDLPLVNAYMTRAISGNYRPSETQFRIVRASDGAVRTIHARGEWATQAPGPRILRGIQQDITEVVQTRERLDEAERQYRFLFEHNPLPMWVYDRETLAFIEVNQAMLTSYGYSREELLRGTVLDIRPAEERDALRASAAGDPMARPQGSIWTHLRRDGSRLLAEVHALPVDFHGRKAWLVMALDVTQREHDQQRFQLIARATSDAIWDYDGQTGATWRSDSYFALFGYERADIAPDQDAWAALVHPDDLARTVASIHRCLTDRALLWEQRYRFRRKDGSYADVYDRGIHLYDEHGRVIRVVGGMLDLTQRNRDEEDLRLLRRAVESTDNGVVIADARQPGLPIVYANPAYERMTGETASTLIDSDRHLLDATIDADPREVAALQRAIDEQREVRVLLRQRRKDGVVYWNDLQLAPVRNEAGALTHFVSVQADVTDRQRAQEQLAFSATHDDLTGLPNRHLLVDRLQQALLNAERHHRSIVVLFIDLDDFKLINDSLGHSAGDEALRQVARRLATAVSEADTVARFGGDEFVVLMSENTDDTSVQQAIARIAASLSSPFDVSGASHYLGASIGWCRSPDAGTDAEALLMRADLAMYKAKQGGRNRAVAYEHAFDDQVSARLRMVSELRSALERGEFELFFQPLFDMACNPVAIEALLRWHHPARGLLLPGHFIGMCEEAGLIVPLSRWVLQEAARHRSALVASGHGPLRIAVNISSLHFQQDLFADVEAVVRAFALPTGALELEITESVIMDNPEAAIEVMRRLDGLGVALSVDDFGTGYSSLSYLKRLPIDRLKIDRSFVRDLAEDADDAAICATVITLAHSLGLRTVAEGVESEAQLQWLRERGCDEMQGFLLGQPQPFAQVLAGLGNARTVSA